MTATASRVERWLLVEHPGAWGPQSVPVSRMPVPTARHLAAVAQTAGARLLMVRRPAATAGEPGRQVFAVDSRPGAEGVRTCRVDRDDELLQLDWPSAGGWEPYDGPLYLVCTHGRHDRCCALLGRPVAKALAQAHAARTWECSHIGGDRFAANVVVLPEGLYLGRIEADEVVDVVAALSEGQLPAGHVRGRSSLPMPVQAAQHFARAALNRWHVGDLAPVGQHGAGPDTWRVQLAGLGRDVAGVELPGVEVVVRYDRAGDGEPHLLTCDATEPKTPPRFRQVSLSGP
jgi:hypothetical protein